MAASSIYLLESREGCVGLAMGAGPAKSSIFQDSASLKIAIRNCNL